MTARKATVFRGTSNYTENIVSRVSVVEPYDYRIVLLLSCWDDRIIKGVNDFAEKAGWSVDLSFSRTGRIPEINDGCRSGIISWISNNRLVIERLESMSVPVVDIGSENSLSRPSICLNAFKIAKCVIDYFRDRGFKDLVMIYSDERSFSSEIRGALEGEAENCMHFRALPTSAISDWLDALKGPQAVFALNDYDAVGIVRQALQAGIRIPDELAVLGMGANDLVCTTSRVPLSSVDVNHVDLGFQAAALLGDLINGKVSTGRPETAIKISPVGVTTRRSTDTFALNDPDARRALSFIRETYRTQIGRAEIHKMIGGNVAKVERTFKKCLGRTMLDELNRLRITDAVSLLSMEHVTIEEIGVMCGFESRYHFQRIFCRKFGCTPRAYRQKLWADSYLKTFSPLAGAE